jgi:hypothetical protein
MEQEIWKDVVGYEGSYQVSNLGRIKSLDRHIRQIRNNKVTVQFKKGRILSPSMCKGGLKVNVSIDGIDKTVKVHNLVLEAFSGERPIGYHACHFPDRSYLNNSIGNLRWDTPSNNEKDKKYHGTDNRGQRHNMVEITTDTALKIKKMLLNHGPKYVSDNLNVKRSIVANIKYGYSWAWLKI